jgi:general secretion pathway protein D
VIDAMTTRPPGRRHRGAVAAVLAVLLAVQPVLAQQASITPNYKDADIRQVIEAVGEVTGRNFILDPRVKAQVTMLSASPMTPDAFYEVFLSILSVYGFIAVPSGDVIKILPDSNARQQPGAELEPGGGGRPDDIVTRVIPVQNVAAAQLVPILRPLIPQYGHLAAHPPSNLLIISDRAANVERMARIIARIDQSADQDYEVLRLEHASASEIVKIIGALNQGGQQAEGGGPRVTVVADERTNSLLITGDKNERIRYRALVTHLDTPLEEGGDTQVRYLRYSEAKDLATKLQSQYGGGGGGGGAAPGKDGAAPPSQRGDISIWADETTNALILTAPPKIMRSMMTVIDKLDIRRLQVLVEAVIVEISSDRASELGVTWAVGDRDLETAVAVTKFPNTTGVSGVAGAILGGGSAGSGSGSGGTTPTNPTALLRNGMSVGLGRLSDSGISFVALIEALESDGNSNIIGTPVLVTLDNEEAEIKVGQEVPFVTGQFTNTGAQTGATVNPFQTIQRQQVGLSLKLTPQINEGDAVLLKIEQEVSSLLPSSQAVDLITANRNINTSVIVEDGGTLVLGGLIEDRLSESQSRVPILGRIPLLGVLFRADRTQKNKTNLMVFIRPTILRDDVQAAFETNAKYNYIRDQQMAMRPNRPRLMPLTPRDVLPPIEQQVRESPGAIDLRGLGTGAAEATPSAPPAPATGATPPSGPAGKDQAP